MTTRLDIIVFGASGFSGQYVLEQLQKMIPTQKKIAWGVAGRSRKKLQQILKELELKTGSKFTHLPIFEADTKNEQSLLDMASKARLLINCVGPYKFHGEQVVRACILKKCHYIDITAEVQFMERIQLVYNEDACKNGVYVVTSCGMDNIPADMGLEFLRKNFDGTLNSVEWYQELEPEEGFGKGTLTNYATWESFLHMILDYQELKKTRSKLFPQRLPVLEPKLKMRYLHRIPFSRNFAGPYPGGEATVMRRSQRYFYETTKSRPSQIHTYFGTPKIWHYILFFIGYMCLLLLLKFQCFINLLLNHPKIFNFGFFNSDPSKDAISKLRVTNTLYGRGWKGKVVDENYKEVEDSWIVTKIKGKDPYVITGICTAASALVLLDESQKVPEKGGVYTSAGFFTGTNLVEVLQRNGLEFEVRGQGSF